MVPPPYRLRISTRRFWALPSSVSFVATGRAAPGEERSRTLHLFHDLGSFAPSAPPAELRLSLRDDPGGLDLVPAWPVALGLRIEGSDVVLADGRHLPPGADMDLGTTAVRIRVSLEEPAPVPLGDVDPALAMASTWADHEVSIRARFRIANRGRVPLLLRVIEDRP